MTYERKTLSMQAATDHNTFAATDADTDTDERLVHFTGLNKRRWSLSQEKNIAELIASWGEDITRQGLETTPQRFLKSMQYLTSGYRVDIYKLVGGALFDAPHQDMIVVQDIEFFSLCEHHLLPFYGKCHVAYIPDKTIIGLSKIPRIVNAMSRRLQVQERLTLEISQAINTVLNPLGVGVVMEAYHMCMMMRGVQKQNSLTITSHLEGSFKRPKTREEFLRLVCAPWRT